MITKLNSNQFTFVTIKNRKSPDDKCQGFFNVYLNVLIYTVSKEKHAVCNLWQIRSKCNQVH